MLLPGLFYVNSVRIECDFDIAAFQEMKDGYAPNSPQSLVSISFARDQLRIPLTEALITGHTFNLLATAHSSRKVGSDQIVGTRPLCL
jgi:hypothetical protein